MLGFLAVFAVLGIIGIWMQKRKKAGNSGAARSDTENAADLNDCFNRARYMSRDEN